MDTYSCERGDRMAKRMNFYLTDVEVKRLNEMSKKTGLTASEIVRRAIDEYWERFEKKGRGKT
jgi:predicted DNA-binding protein